MKVAVVAPAATVTDVGTVAAVVDELVMVTTSPLGPAALLSVTVPVIVTLHPPTTVADERVTLETLAGWTVRVAVEELEPTVAVIVSDVEAATAVDVIVNVAVDLPEATVTEAGTVALVPLDLSVTTVPAVGAAADIVTVPVLDTPPATEVGLKVTELTVYGFTVRTAVRVILL